METGEAAVGQLPLLRSANARVGVDSEPWRVVALLMPKRLGQKVPSFALTRLEVIREVWVASSALALQNGVRVAMEVARRLHRSQRKVIGVHELDQRLERRGEAAMSGRVSIHIRCL